LVQSATTCEAAESEAAESEALKHLQGDSQMWHQLIMGRIQNLEPLKKQTQPPNTGTNLYMCHVIDKDRICLMTGKIEAIENMLIPRDQKELG